MILPLAVLCLLGLGVGAFAFSGSPSSESPAPARPSAATAKLPLAEWAAKVGAICARGNKQLEAVGQPATPADLAEYTLRFLAIVTPAVNEIARLGAPQGSHAQDAKDFVRLNREGLSLAQELGAALTAGDQDALLRVQKEIADLQAETDRLSAKLGVAACAEDAAARSPKTATSALERLLKKHSAVVVILYSPDSPLDTLATREARAGALAARAGFMAVDVTDEQAAAALASAYRVREAPALFVFGRGPTLVTQIGGFADRDTVAQAAQNAVS